MPQLRTTPARPRRSDRDALPPDVGRARWALVGLFAVNGLTLSAWLARLPAIRDALDLAPSQLGSVLLAAALGGLATMTVAPRIVGRLGQAGAIRVFGSLFGAAYLLMGLAAATASLPLLAAGLFLNGIAFATTNLAINIGSADVERRVGRPILSQSRRSRSARSSGRSAEPPLRGWPSPCSHNLSSWPWSRSPGGGRPRRDCSPTGPQRRPASGASPGTVRRGRRTRPRRAPERATPPRELGFSRPGASREPSSSAPSC
jgi:hypothetical protein